MYVYVDRLVDDTLYKEYLIIEPLLRYLPILLISDKSLRDSRRRINHIIARS